jgi:hypothetical protein
LKAGAKTTYRDKNNFSPLSNAIHKRNIPGVKALVEAGHSLNGIHLIVGKYVDNLQDIENINHESLLAIAVSTGKFGILTN